jgi:hypothetical protein
MYILQGLVVSTIFTTEINAHQVTMTTFYPILLLSGNDKIQNIKEINELYLRYCMAFGRTTDMVTNDNEMVTNDKSY